MWLSQGSPASGLREARLDAGLVLRLPQALSTHAGTTPAMRHRRPGSHSANFPESSLSRCRYLELATLVGTAGKMPQDPLPLLSATAGEVCLSESLVHTPPDEAGPRSESSTHLPSIRNFRMASPGAAAPRALLGSPTAATGHLQVTSLWDLGPPSPCCHSPRWAPSGEPTSGAPFPDPQS